MCRIILVVSSYGWTIYGDDIAHVLKQRGLDWTPERLRRTVKWLTAEQWPALNCSENPRPGCRERTPRRGTKWLPSSVKNHH